MKRSLLFLAAEIAVALVALAGGTRPQPADRAALERPVQAKKEQPKYHTTDRTKFWLDGVEVTLEEFNRHDGLVIEEIVIDGDEVLVLKARTKGK